MTFHFTATEMNNIAKKSKESNTDDSMTDFIIEKIGEKIKKEAQNGNTEIYLNKAFFQQVASYCSGQKKYTKSMIEYIMYTVKAKVKKSTDFHIDNNYSEGLLVQWDDAGIELARQEKGMAMYNSMMKNFRDNMNIVIYNNTVTDWVSGTIYEKCDYPVENGLAKMKKKLSHVFKSRYYDKEFRLIKMTHSGNCHEAVTSDYTSYDLKNYKDFTFYKPINSWYRKFDK